MASLANSAKHLRNNTNFHKFFQNLREDGTLVNTFYETSITLIPNPDKDITTKTTTTINYRPVSLMKIDAKILNKLLIN